MNKKILSLILTILLVTMCSTVMASQTPMISISSAQASAGDTVEINVSLKNNPGIVNMRLFVNYNSSALELVEVKDKAVFGSAIHSNNLSAMPYTLCWSNDTASTNFTTTGDIVTLKFKIKSGATAKNYPITVTYDNNQYDICNKDLEVIDFAVSSGSITVKGTDLPVLPETIELVDKKIVNGKTEITVTLPENAKGKVGCLAYSGNKYKGSGFCDANAQVTFSVSNSSADKVKIVWWNFSILSPYSEYLEINL